MIRLSDFITKIRNCKTIAEERAETQKQMAAIRQSFYKGDESLRLRNVTKLLYINMMGQDTDFGQMECLKLITASSFIEKRIGYLGLTQLFNQQSALLMMATNRIRIDLTNSNNYIVALTLSVLSEVCTTELAKEIAPEIIKIIGNSNGYIRKKALLTATKIIRKSPEFIPEFLVKVESTLDEKQHGVLLGAIGFLETVLVVDDSHASKMTRLIPKITKIYKSILSHPNPEYEISGTNDPFLQVSILKFMRNLMKHEASIAKDVTEIVVQVHEHVCNKGTSLKNGANAVLFECFQTMLPLQMTSQLREIIIAMMSKFVSVKDANSKYLTLYTLNLLAKHDLQAVQNHRITIYECLNENDILIRVMALDLLYIIANQDNVVPIIKDLHNTLLNATDEEFIAELALKICLIVDKQSPSRRWHFDSILKVLILAGQSIKEDSVSSLIHLVTATPQLQSYAMIKLFFSTVENNSNETLCKTTLYLLGEFAQVLLNNREVSVTEDNILSLVENIILRVGVSDETIAYGLTTLFKLAEKSRDKSRVLTVINNFSINSNLEVQKRACEYAKLLQAEWDDERKAEICIPVPVLPSAGEAFTNIPIGSTDGALEQLNLVMPEKQEHKLHADESRPLPVAVQKPAPTPTIPVSSGLGGDIFGLIEEPPKPTVVKQTTPQPPPSTGLNIFDGDIFGITPPAPTQLPVIQTQSTVVQPPATGFDINFGLGGLNFGTAPVAPPPLQGNNLYSMYNPGFTMGAQPVAPIINPTPAVVNPSAKNVFDSLDVLGGFGSTPAPVAPYTANPPSQNLGGFSLLGNNQPVNPVSQPANNNNLLGFSLLGAQPTVSAPSSANSFKAFENRHLELKMSMTKESADTTNVVASYSNKTGSAIERLVISVAAMKHLKSTTNPASSQTLAPYARDALTQQMKIVNTAVGQKGIVLKIKLEYLTAGESVVDEGKITFPEGY